MASNQEAKLVVKHTFLEFVQTPEVRSRSLTDSAAFATAAPSGASDSVSHTAGTESTCVLSDVEEEPSNQQPSPQQSKQHPWQGSGPVAQSPTLAQAQSPSWSPWSRPIPDEWKAFNFEALPTTHEGVGLEQWSEQEACWWMQGQYGHSGENVAGQAWGFIPQNGALGPVEQYAWMQEHGMQFDPAQSSFVPLHGYPQQGEHDQTQDQTAEYQAGTETVSVEDTNAKKALGSRVSVQVSAQPRAASGNSRAHDSQRTTVMLRNLPAGFSRDNLVELLEQEGYVSGCDFIYLPIDFSSGLSLGYAFVDLVSPAIAAQFFEHFDGFSRWCAPNEAVCTATWSEPHQGLARHVERYRNSPVMHCTAPDEWKPIVLADGVRVPFPPPTKHIKAPKIRSRLYAGQ